MDKVTEPMCTTKTCSIPAYDPLSEAIRIAATYHAGQRDKAGQAYILHPLAVMDRIKFELTQYPEKTPTGYTFEQMLEIAVLHDVVEDTSFTLNRTEGMFGKLVADGVDSVTRRKEEGETYANFILRAKSNPAGKLVKIADILHNLSRIESIFTGEKEFLIKRYTKALEVLNG